MMSSEMPTPMSAIAGSLARIMVCPGEDGKTSMNIKQPIGDVMKKFK
jgi:ApbE superfamily uncharacterized protein (UPF0280 family)